MPETVLRFGDADALRVRFAVSPLWETLAAIRLRHTDGHRRALYDPWLAARATVDLDVEVLRAVQPRIGTTPDFLAPPPATSEPEFAAELERVRATPVERVVRELTASRDDGANPLGERIDELLRDPAGTLRRIVGAIKAGWDALVRPDWPTIRRVLADDVAHRGRQLTRGGLAELFGELHPNLSWRDGDLVSTSGGTGRRDLGGAGLLLVPSVFNWPYVSVVVDPAYQPALVYPARGTARIWTSAPPPPDRLSRLLGRTRAALLADLDPPATTSELATRHGLAVATVSEHLTVLHGAGLADKRRTAREIHYRRTELGQALLDAALT